jgi:spermidine/putrescine transport system ATP-binding protein
VNSTAVEERGRGSLALSQVSKSYGDFVAVKPTDLTVFGGEFLALLGPSGSGKTTLLRVIGGLVSPTTGRVFLDGEAITDVPIYDRPCNTVFQDYALFPHMRVADNVGFGLSVRRHPKREIARRVDEMLKTVGLQDLRDRYPSQLSGGQRQRVALARAMICEPRLILLDEPLAALDASLRHQMQEMLKSVQRKLGITFIFVTHDQSEAIAIADRIAVMNNGRIEQIASPADLYYRPQTAFVAGFFGENNLIPATLRRSGSSAVAETSVGTFPLPTDQTAAEGAACIVAVRPEVVSLETDPSSARAIAGRIMAVGGSQTRIKFVPDADQNLCLHCLMPSQLASSSAAVGDKAHLVIPDNYAVVVP